MSYQMWFRLAITLNIKPENITSPNNIDESLYNPDEEIEFLNMTAKAESSEWDPRKIIHMKYTAQHTSLSQIPRERHKQTVIRTLRMPPSVDRSRSKSSKQSTVHTHVPATSHSQGKKNSHPSTGWSSFAPSMHSPKSRNKYNHQYGTCWNVSTNFEPSFVW